MALSWKVEVFSDHLVIACEGEFDLHDAKEVGASAYALAAQHQKGKVLIDWRRMTGSPTDTDRFEMGRHVAEAYAKQNPMRYVRVAVVGNDQILSPIRLGEMAARNRGAQGMVTTDLREALAYLEIEEPGS